MAKKKDTEGRVMQDMEVIDTPLLQIADDLVVNFDTVTRVELSNNEGEQESVVLHFAKGRYRLPFDVTGQVIKAVESNPLFIRIGTTFYNLCTIETILPASTSPDDTVANNAKPGDLEITFTPVWDSNLLEFQFSTTLLVVGDEATALSRRLDRISQKLPGKHMPSRSKVETPKPTPATDDAA